MRRWTGVMVLCTAITLGACGSDDSDSTSESAATTTTTAADTGGNGQLGIEGRMDVAADPKGALRFIPDEVTATANDDGELTVVLDNESGDPHNICVVDQSGKELLCSGVLSNANVTNVIKEIKPGTYDFYCDVDGHREAGMTGTLTVE
jgi:plastocyanin